MKILCIGEALIDMICTDKGSLLTKCEHFLKKPGGAPTNVAAAIAALGGNVTLAAKVGADPFGKQLIDVMKEFGVSSNWMLEDSNSFTTFAFVSLMEDGERDFVFNRGADGQLSESDLENLHLEDFSIIHFGSATAFLPGPLQQAYKSILHKAICKNIFVSFDPNYRHLLFKNNANTFVEQSWHFIKHCHFFKVSDEEAMLITGSTTVGEAAALFSENSTATFAITLGKEGTMLVHQKQRISVPSIPVNPIDTTGAGDAFVGAVLYQLGMHNLQMIQDFGTEEWKQIISNGNKAGARTCEYMGAMEAFKHLNNQIFE
ncbi:MAG: carbohydrate kinase [Chitinophagaceae bacterium]